MKRYLVTDKVVCNFMELQTDIVANSERAVKKALQPGRTQISLGWTWAGTVADCGAVDGLNFNPAVLELKSSQAHNIPFRSNTTFNQGFNTLENV